RRLLKATIYERSRAFSAWHVVLQCPGQCKGTYYANKHVMRHGEYKGHFFRALEDGTSPKYITNKSGKCAVAVAFLRDVTVMICRMRAGFDQISDWYRRTVQATTGQGTTPLAGDQLRTCWAIYAVLQHFNGPDLWAWAPPAGHVITYNTPQEVVIMEK
ncbi:unnamed protein product, partial [Ascophyllum nodosum]